VYTGAQIVGGIVGAAMARAMKYVMVVVVYYLVASLQLTHHHVLFYATAAPAPSACFTAP